ncbi:MAG: DUF3108 domain-containing protein [Chitinivibrionales bacterium]|nr:DUF3108 domain-containing protein [Chitinivibrionales bacterium]
MLFRLFLLTLLALWLPVVARDDDEERWVDLERAVDTTGFPMVFRDSLRTAHEVPLDKGMRTVESPVLGRPEKLVLRAKWGFIPAGYGILTMRPDSLAGVAHLTATAVTNRFIGALYKVQDYIRTTTSLTGLYPVFYEEHIKEGRYERDRWALYDHANGVVYSSRKKHPRVEAPRFVMDFLTSLYYVRSRPLMPGDTFSVTTYVQGKVYPVKFRCTGKEVVKTDAGEFDCVMVEPTLVGSGRISRRDRLTLWLTDDERHMLVKVKSKINVGSVNAELIYYEVDGVAHGKDR